MNYYVSTTGSDQGPGSITQPWKTIQKAANTMVAGDTVYIRAGTYPEQVIPQYSGSPGNYITYISYPGESVTIDGGSLSLHTADGLFHIKPYFVGDTKVRRAYIRVSGLRIINAKGGADAYGGYDVTGIRVDESDNIIIEKNSTYNTRSSGVGVWNSTYVVVDGNEIALACNLGGPDNQPGAEENISIANSSYIEVKNNHVHEGAPIDAGWSGGEGINVKEGSHDVKVYRNVVHLERIDGKPPTRLAFGLDAWSKETYNVSFYDNLAYKNHAGFVVESEHGGTAHDISVYNNIAHNNEGAGFYIPNWARNETSLKKNIQFINNTSYNNEIGIFINSIKIENVVIRNNIFSQNGTAIEIGSGVPQAQIISDHNFTGGDPRFVNPAGEDFHLQSGSPAIDTGSSLNAPNRDFEGNLRFQGAGYDIGAYEFVVLPSPHPLSKLQTLIKQVSLPPVAYWR